MGWFQQYSKKLLIRQKSMSDNDDMKQLGKRLSLLGPVIEQICNVSRTSGVAIGVMKRHEVVYTTGFGFSDREAHSVPDENTIFHIASLTKSVTAAASMQLVHEEKIDASAPIANIIPEFHLRDEWVGKHVTLTDILANRVGIAGGNGFWSQAGNRCHLKKEDLIQTLGSLPQVQPFRAGFMYHNMLYGFVAEVIERVTGQSYGTYLEERLFSPLGMTRTSVKINDSSPDNYAKTYMPMDNGDYVEITRPQTGDGTMQASAGGVRSSVKDLMTFYDAIMSGRTDPVCSSPTAVIKEAPRLTAGHTFLSEASEYERSYALGLLRVQLPGTFGDVGPNVGLVKMPVIGKGDQSRLVLYHQGSYPGVLSAALIVPEEEMVIVVLTNSLSLNDGADWIGQLVLEHALDLSQKTDFVGLAKESKEAYLTSFSESETKYNVGREQNTSCDLESYVGNYWNSVYTFFIKVYLEEGQLKMSYQGSTDEWDIYNLEPYAKDTFSWYTSRDDQARRGRWPTPACDYFNFIFTASENGEIAQLIWHMDGSVPDGEVFKKGSPHYSGQTLLVEPKI